MKFIEIAKGRTVNVNAIDQFTADAKGLAIIHLGLEQIKTSFPYDSLKNLLSIDNIGDGPNPAATALAY